MFLVLSFPFPSFLYVCVRTLSVVTLAGNYLYPTFLLIQFLIVAIYALVSCIVSSPSALYHQQTSQTSIE